MDAGMSLTYWQHSTVPEAFKDKKLALSMRKMVTVRPLHLLFNYP